MNKIPEWLKDWMDFQEHQSEVSSTRSLDRNFLSRIQKDLNPTRSQVLIKISVIHTITALISLLICPQMGVGGALSSFSLMDVFMTFGHSVCFFMCGAFFISGTLIMARVFLEVEERQRLFKDRFLIIPGIVIFSFGVLSMAGDTSHGGHLNSYLVSTYWILGSIVSGFLGVQLLKRSKNFVRL